MNMHSRIRAAVLGATGYTGRELIRLLARHPRVALAFASSEAEAGRSLRGAWAGAPDLALQPADTVPFGECDVVFSCLPHGESARYAARAHAAGARVVDLSQDLRVPGEGEASIEAVYGLSELYRSRIAEAQIVANPGCYPTAALLALAPLLRRGLIAGPVIVQAASGVTGAGRTAKRELLYAEVAEDYRAYAAGNTHRHLSELRDQVRRLADQAPPELVFAPHLLPVKRGILETIFVPLREAARVGVEIWAEDYAGEPFIEVYADRLPSLGDVVGTNRVAIAATPLAGLAQPMLQLTAAIDNLLKGASGQAVQNMNLMFGFAEPEGLPC
jgi:N-acetyl-gamma-glutamyl-phosphate reductase